MEQFEPGYGGAAPQGAAPQEAPAQEQDPIAAAVQEFMATQDPQIAVQIVMALAEQMGIQAPEQQAAPAPEAPAGPPAAAPEAGQPMMRNGGKMRFYRRGGKI